VYKQKPGSEGIMAHDRVGLFLEKKEMTKSSKVLIARINTIH